MITARTQRSGAQFVIVAVFDGGLAVASLLFVVFSALVDPSLVAYWFIAPFLLVTALSAWFISRVYVRQTISRRWRIGAGVLQLAVLGTYLLSVSQFRGEVDIAGLVWGGWFGPIVVLTVISSLVLLAWRKREH